MKREDLFIKNKRELTIEVENDLDKEEVRTNLNLAHLILSTLVADAILDLQNYPYDKTNVGLVYAHGVYYGEMQGLCLALRSISGTKYNGIDFSDSIWLEENRSKP